MDLPKRILGVDFGTKRIGISLSDESLYLATSYPFLNAGASPQKSAEILLDYIKKKEKEMKCQISLIVVGYPIHLSGKESPSSLLVKSFKKTLEEKGTIPIFLFDERLTSTQADRSLKDQGLTRKKRSVMIDSFSASILLQSFLDQRANLL